MGKKTLNDAICDNGKSILKQLIEKEMLFENTKQEEVFSIGYLLGVTDGLSALGINAHTQEIVEKLCNYFNTEPKLTIEE